MTCSGMAVISPASFYLCFGLVALSCMMLSGAGDDLRQATVRGTLVLFASRAARETKQMDTPAFSLLLHSRDLLPLVSLLTLLSCPVYARSFFLSLSHAFVMIGSSGARK